MRVGISVRSERLMGGMGFHFHLNSSVASTMFNLEETAGKLGCLWSSRSSQLAWS